MLGLIARADSRDYLPGEESVVLREGASVGALSTIRGRMSHVGTLV